MEWYTIGKDCWLLVVFHIPTLREWCIMRRANKFFRDLINFETCWKYWKEEIYFPLFDEPKSFIDWLPNLNYYDRLTYRGPRIMDLEKEKEPLELTFFGFTKEHFFYSKYDYNQKGDFVFAKRRSERGIFISELYPFDREFICTDHHLFFRSRDNADHIFVCDRELKVSMVEIPKEDTDSLMIKPPAIILRKNTGERIAFFPKSLSPKEFTFEKKIIQRIDGKKRYICYIDKEIFATKETQSFWDPQKGELISWYDGENFNITSKNIIDQKRIHNHYWIIDYYEFAHLSFLRFEISNRKQIKLDVTINDSNIHTFLSEDEKLKEEIGWSIKDYDIVSHYLFLQIQNQNGSFLIHLDMITLKLLSKIQLSECSITISQKERYMGAIKSGNKILTFV